MNEFVKAMAFAMGTVIYWAFALVTCVIYVITMTIGTIVECTKNYLGLWVNAWKRMYNKNISVGVFDDLD